MGKLLSAIITLLFISSTSLLAAPINYQSSPRQTALLELYTSEGCSSCPPADRWLSSLKKQEGLWQDFIPIALHVDYWDYIGWKDRFASPIFAARQRQYAKEQAVSTVYTPGFTYNGTEFRSWYKKDAGDFPQGDKPGILKLQLVDNQASIKFTPTAMTKNNLKVNLALLGFALQTQIKAGENKGKKLAHDFVVLAMSQAILDKKDNEFTLQLDMPSSDIKSKRYGVVAWVNNAGSQKPIQTVGGWLQ